MTRFTMLRQFAKWFIFPSAALVLLIAPARSEETPVTSDQITNSVSMDSKAQVEQKVLFFTNREDSDPTEPGEYSWGSRSVSFNHLGTLEAQMAIELKDDLLSVVCAPADPGCVDLFMRSSSELQSATFDSFELGAEVQHVWLDTPVSSSSMARIFHGLSFLKAADSSYRQRESEALPRISRDAVDQNLNRIFAGKSRRSAANADLLAQIQDTTFYTNHQGHLARAATTGPAIVNEGYLPATLLLHQLTANFQARVAERRLQQTDISTVPQVLPGDMTQHIRSLLKRHRQRPNENCNAILVYIHGYNSTFADSIRDTAYTAQDSSFCGVAISFSWPSRGTLGNLQDCTKPAARGTWENLMAALPKQSSRNVEEDRTCSFIEKGALQCADAYVSDRTSSELSIAAFRRLLEILDAARLPDTDLHVVAHSMGGHLIATWAEMRLAAKAEGFDTSEADLSSLTLIAPDVWTEQFGRLAPQLNDISRGVTIFGTHLDGALEFSRCLHKTEYKISLQQVAKGRLSMASDDRSDRLGILSKATLGLTDDIEILDVSAVLYLGQSNHSHHRSNKRIASELNRIFVAGDRALQPGNQEWPNRSSERYEGRTLLLDTSLLQDLVLPDHMEDFWARKLSTSD